MISNTSERARVRSGTKTVGNAQALGYPWTSTHRPQRPRLAQQEAVVALCVPLGGTAGIWGPSALACAKLAVSELNSGTGIGGKPCRLLTVNAADDAPELEETLDELLGAGDIDAIVGMHTSAVRHRMLESVGGRVPYVYTSQYEGGEVTPGVFAIGETSARQLRPAIRWLCENKRPRRWFTIGNDYVWPRVSHRIARSYIADAGGELVGDIYVPFGITDFSQVFDLLKVARADAVLLSLIGHDAVEFNRAFSAAGLSRSMLRLSCSVGENELLGIGCDHTEDLFVASGYFAALDTDANLEFKQNYRDHFGERAPTLNTFGQSTYEGLHFLAALLDPRDPEHASDRYHGRIPLNYSSARSTNSTCRKINSGCMYLARADGIAYRMVARW